MAHPRAKRTVAGRRLLVERVLEQGWPPARAAEAQGASAATAYKWLGRWRAEGLAGLADRSCRPHRSPRRLLAAREQAIVAFREQHRVGPHRIGWALGEASSTVHAVLRRHQVPRLAELDRPTGQVVRYQRQRPGELVHLDVKKQGRIPDGGGHRIHGANAPWGGQRKQGLGDDFVHVAIDDCSRVAYLEVHPDEQAQTVAGFAGRVLAFYAGLVMTVERMLTDNGAGYRSRVFGQVLAAAGVVHKRTRPYRPATNGKAERQNLTLEREWAYARPYHSNQQRLDTLPAWLHDYNHHRPHRALDGRSPCSYSTTSPARTPSRRSRRTTVRGNQVRLRLPPKTARTAGPPEGAAAPMDQSREAHRSARPLHPPEGA
jgi:transposase InsO family protein